MLAASARYRLNNALIMRFLMLMAGALFVTGCDRREVREDAPASAPAQRATAVLRESVEISAAQNSEVLTAAHHASLTKEGDAILIRATGDDPQLTFAVRGASARPTTVYVDLESPAASTMQLFYQVGIAPFSADNVISTPTVAGRNRVVFQVQDPRASGTFRLDPGLLAGEYRLRSIIVFADVALSLVTPARPQEELAAAFEAAASIYAARTAEEFAKFRPLKDVELKPAPAGLALNATGADASLMLPPFQITAPAIAKIAIRSPAETMLQLFYQVNGAPEYTEARSVSHLLSAGENLIYIELSDPEITGALRFDPGFTLGAYELKEIEVRSTGPSAP